MGQSGTTTKKVSCFFSSSRLFLISWHICSEAFFEWILRIALYPLPVWEFWLLYFSVSSMTWSLVFDCIITNFLIFFFSLPEGIMDHLHYFSTHHQRTFSVWFSNLLVRCTEKFFIAMIVLFCMNHVYVYMSGSNPLENSLFVVMAKLLVWASQDGTGV